MTSTEKVAMLALLLRETWRERHTHADAHLDDIMTCPDYLSLATLAAGAAFGEAEWELVKLLDADGPGWAVVRAAGDLQSEGAPLHAEALMHAYGEKGKRTRAAWAKPFMRRWWDVRRAMTAYEREGITKTFGDAANDADRAYMKAKHVDVDELYERYPPPEDEPLPACITR
jgi:hypothetical protein